MRNQTRHEQDQYINNLAKQVMSKEGININYFNAFGTTARQFTDHIGDNVYDWVKRNLTNPATLAKVVQCAVDYFELRSGRTGRRTRFIDVSHKGYQDMDGITLLRLAAMWTICAAIYDTFLVVESASQKDHAWSKADAEIGDEEKEFASIRSRYEG